MQKLSTSMVVDLPPRALGAGATPSRRRFRLAVQTLVAAFAFMLMIAAFSAVRAENGHATVEAREENGYGRVVFNFDRLPAYRQELDSGVLVLWFEEPVEIDLAEVPKDLPDYIGLARRDPDGRALRFALNRTFRINVMEAGDQLYVDILPAEWRGIPPPLPSHVIKALSRMAAEAEKKAREEERQREAAKFPYELDIRLARNPTFSRIVFDWNRFVSVNLSRQGSQVRVKFGAKADAHLAALKTDPPKYLTGAELKKSAYDMELVLAVDEDVDVRGFREGNSYIVDLTGPDVAASASAGQAAKLLGIPSTAADGSLPDDAKDVTVIPGERAATEEPDDAGPPSERADVESQPMGPEELDEAATTQIAAAPDVPQPPDAPEQAATAAPMPERRPEPEAAAAAQDKTPVSPLRLAPADRRERPFLTAQTASPLLLAPPARRPAETAVAPAKKATEEKAAATKAKPVPAAAKMEAGLRILVESAGPNMRLLFPFGKPVSAAAFRRGRTIWLLFDSTERLDLTALKEAAAQGGKLRDVQHIRTNSMQYLRLRLSRAWLTYVAERNDAWTVDIGDTVSGPAEQVTLSRKLRDDKRSMIVIKLQKPGRVHWLSDPDIGDRLAVVTAFSPQRSVAKPQDFVEFDALATAHGLAFQINSDDVAVRLKLDEVIVTRRNGLTLSAGNAHQYVRGRKPLAETGRVGFLDFKAREVKDPGRLSKRIHAQQRAVAMAGDDQRNDRRFDLARLYAANGFEREALGVLKRMRSVDPALDNDPAFNVLRGAVLTLLGRTRDARKDFRVHALANDQDAALWIGLLDSAEENWESALQHFEEGADAIGSYRDDLQDRFRLAAARSALELKRLSRAADELDAIHEPARVKALEAQRQLLRGWYLESIGRTDEAMDSYNTVLKGDQRPAIAEAELRTIGLLLREKKIKQDEAMAGLERLLVVWRGDRIELRAMRLLADLYVNEKRYRDAFNIMRNGLRAFPNSDIALQIQDDMKLVFRDLYLEGEKKGLKPVESLALYYDFLELMPVGRKGDEMIRRLADDLIRFDLLDQAAELLDHQVKKRLKGAARSQVATRLAMVHLMNHKPELALGAIRQTRQAGLTGDLRRSRSLLEARALGDLGRAETAIEILNTLQGEDAERLKADALWSAQKWQGAGAQFEKMLGPRWQEGEPLSDAERFDVLRSAIAYALAGDQFGLDRIAKKYYEKMIKTRDADAFVIVTKPIKSQGVTFRQLAKDIAAVDTLDAFMKDFRARYDSATKPERTSANPEDRGAG